MQIVNELAPASTTRHPDRTAGLVFRKGRFPMITLRVAAAALLLMGATSSRGDDAGAIAPGTRLRVFARTLGNKPLVGVLQSLRDNELTLAAEGHPSAVVVPRQEVTRIDRSGGRHSRGRWAIRGAGLGLLIAEHRLRDHFLLVKGDRENCVSRCGPVTRSRLCKQATLGADHDPSSETTSSRRRTRSAADGSGCAEPSIRGVGPRGCRRSRFRSDTGPGDGSRRS